MKIKTVCEQTGLSDRAVRFYMEEKLIAPSYTENYLGRKSIDFSQEDVDVLRDIAVLRKFGFSIEEIRELQQDPASSVQILPDIRGRKQKVVAEEQEALTALLRLDETKPYGVSELAQALSAPAEERELPAEDQEDRLGLRKKLRLLTLFGLVVLPVLLPWFWFNWNISHWSGLAMMDWPFHCGCVLALGILLTRAEWQGRLLGLSGGALVLTDYVLAFVCFQERANISGKIDLATSMRVTHWPFWLACVCMLLYLIHTLLKCAALLRKSE